MTTSGIQSLDDLGWVLTSPSLVEDPLAAGPIEFDRSTVDVDHLQRFLHQRQEHRVGRYFEHLLLYWLVHVRKVELLGAGVQITDEQNRTIGEMDFLFRDEAGIVNHCEAAVKFFLHHPNESGSHFPGPAARDNFERKSTQLFEKQLVMSEEHAPEVQGRLAFVRGRVFERIGWPGPASLPARMSPTRLGGAWVRESELETLETFGDVGFHIVQKPHWFAPAIDGDVLTASEFSQQLVHHFDGPAYPVMVSIRRPDLSEAERCFVVPDAWPQTNSN